MSNTVERSWLTIRSVLDRRAPQSAQWLNGQVTAADLKAIQETFPEPLPPALIQSLTCHNGMQVKPLQARLYPPSFVPHSAKEMASSYRTWIRITRDESESAAGDLGEAGDDADLFLPAFWPIATDTAGDEYFIDLRPGNHYGCVRRWYQSSGATCPLWPGVDSMLEEVSQALETADGDSPKAVLSYRPEFHEGALRWVGARP